MIDPGSEEGKKLEALHKKDYHLRGAYLVQAIYIEQIIGDILSLSLCPNEDSRSLFTSLSVVNRRSLKHCCNQNIRQWSGNTRTFSD